MVTPLFLVFVQVYCWCLLFHLRWYMQPCNMSHSCSLLLVLPRCTSVLHKVFALNSELTTWNNCYSPYGSNPGHGGLFRYSLLCCANLNLGVAYICCEMVHQQNVKWFGSHNRTPQQLWTATLILPDAPRCSQIGWMQSDVLSGALRLLHRCSWILRKLWNRIQEYPEECIGVFKMLPNQSIRMCKFRSYWEYWEYWRRLQDYSGAPRTWRHTLREWLL